MLVFLLQVRTGFGISGEIPLSGLLLEKKLNEATITALCQTRDRYLWIGTQYRGLYRFDGLQFKNYTKANTPELYYDYITALFEDRDGVLWIATSGSRILKYENGRFSGFRNLTVFSIVQDRSGALWFGTYAEGLLRYQNGKVTRFSSANGLSSDVVHSLAVSPADDSLWIGTEKGLDHFSNGKITPVQYPELDTEIRSLVFDQNQMLWIGTFQNGLLKMNLQEKSAPQRIHEIDDPNIFSLILDSNRTLWIGTSQRGMFRLNHGRIEHLDASEGLSNVVLSFAEDQGHDVWVGTGSGLFYFREPLLRTYGTRDGLPFDTVRSISQGSHQDYWLGTQMQGFFRWTNDGRSELYNHSKGLSSDVVRPVLEDHEGGVWIGTFTAGLNRLYQGRITTYTTKDGLSDNTVWALYQDSRQQLWIGTNNGLNVFRNGRFEYNILPGGSPPNTILTLAGSSHETLLIGTDLGLYELPLDSKDLKARQVPYPLLRPPIYFIHEEKDGTLLLGTAGQGIQILTNNRARAVSVNTSNGLFDDIISNIFDDSKGYLWMSSPKGLYRCAKADLMAVADGKKKSVSGFVFGISEGMKSVETIVFNCPAAWKDRDGWMWFPLKSGLLAVDPLKVDEKMKVILQPPPVVIENAVLDQRDLPMQKQITIPAGTNRVQFDFTAISFAAPEKVMCRFQLHGFDKDWVDAGSKRSVTYTNLAPGNYRFQVQGAFPNGSWSEPVGVELRMLPLFYQTFSFRIAAIVASLLSIYFAIVLITKTLRKRNVALEALVSERSKELVLATRNAATIEERHRLAREIHDGLSQQITSTIMQLDAALQALPEKNEAKALVSAASQSARQTLIEAQRTLEALHPASLEEADLSAALKNICANAAIARAIDVQCRIEGEPFHLPDEVEFHFLRIAQEAVQNAIKHSKAQNIDIALIFNSGGVRLEICDDGIGFDPGVTQNETGGLGLKGMKKRAESIGAELKTESSASEGTSITCRWQRS